MALRIIKLFAQATTTTTTTTKPTVLKFFYETVEQTTPGNTLTIDAASFETDSGAAVTELPELPTDNSYFTVEINGALQMQDLLSYTPGATGVGKLEIDVPVGSDPIEAQTPIVLEVVIFDPESTSDTTIIT
ncbi:DUF4183 domain-containing protein [Calidifontibacillus erzurumensis]|uniref:DUF4183 domain-containing protein n=1 Tax=Calidifontibacillus erzurumensis TaxID=2741433 RepID=UPI0035B5102C